MVGNFPSREVFGAIPSLTALALEGNDDLSFSFGGVDKVSYLESIDVSKTNFNSFDSVNLHFTNLKEVYAGRCGLAGQFPSALLDISKLEVLDLSFNHMTGELPRDIGIFLSNMQSLILHDNQFVGILPDSLDNMTELKYIQLDNNSFSGRVPSFYNARGIRGIDIRNQKALGAGLTGIIPTNFLERADGSVIEYVNLSSNYISGELPATLANIPFAKMDFSDNEIESISSALCESDCAILLCPPTTYSDSGSRPSPVENCSPCHSAIYWGATSCGPVSTPLNTVTNPVVDDSQVLKLLYSQCGGEEWTNNEDWLGDDMCSFWGVRCAPNSSGLKYVMSILLPSNNLKCTVPAQIFLLPKLETLVLDGNEVILDFSSIKYAKSLATLSLVSTSISSVDGINQVPSLRKLDLSNTNLVTMPSQIFLIPTLHELYLGPNAFELTPIPTSIGDLTELRLFECSTCHLNGKIPASVSALSNLVSLNLEGNMLTGPLPEGLEALQDLTFLHLSGNFLDGQLLSFSASVKLRRVDLSNNAISGTIPQNFLESVNSNFEYLDLSGNELEGFAPGILSRLQNFDLSDNFITGLDTDLCNNPCGCDCVLCGPGFYNAAGRQDSDANPCIACSDTQSYYGQTYCSDDLQSWDDEGEDINTSSQAYQSKAPTSIEQEKQALTKFYHACAGTYWTKNDFWIDEDYGHCEWYGIKCHPETGSVLSISLGSNNVQCVVQELFDSLPNLSSLSLNSNPLHGFFDFNLLELSQSLRELNLDATGIFAIEGIHKSRSLEAISLRFNDLRQITELSMVTTLKSIRVSHNQLLSLPSFDNLLNLQTVIAEHNNIGGGLDGVSFPPNILFLDLSNNEISSVPFTSFSAVSSASGLDIDLSENQIVSLPLDLCDKGKWNNGDVGRFGCSGLLCGKGYYSKYGRRTTDTDCSPCLSASFMGATICADPAIAVKGQYSSATVSFIVIISVVLCAMLLMIIVRVRRQRALEKYQQREDETVAIAVPRHIDKDII
jgi:Leucine-rich repeat (LRR) protein